MVDMANCTSSWYLFLTYLVGYIRPRLDLLEENSQVLGTVLFVTYDPR